MLFYYLSIINMSFFTTKIENKKGRIGRLNFFLKSLLVILFLLITIWLNPNLLITVILLAAAVLIPYINLLYARTHDIDQTWNIEVYTFVITLLLSLSTTIFVWNQKVEAVLSILSLIWFIGVLVTYLYLLFKKWTTGENKYWTDPLIKIEKDNKKNGINK